MAILDPVGDCSADLTDWVQRIAAIRQGWTLPVWDAAAFEIAEFIRGKKPQRPAQESDVLDKLADLVSPYPF